MGVPLFMLDDGPPANLSVIVIKRTHNNVFFNNNHLVFWRQFSEEKSALSFARHFEFFCDIFLDTGGQLILVTNSPKMIFCFLFFLMFCQENA